MSITPFPAQTFPRAVRDQSRDPLVGVYAFNEYNRGMTTPYLCGVFLDSTGGLYVGDAVYPQDVPECQPWIEVLSAVMRPAEALLRRAK